MFAFEIIILQTYWQFDFNMIFFLWNSCSFRVFPWLEHSPFSYVAKVLRTKCSAPFPSHLASWVGGNHHHHHHLHHVEIASQIPKKKCVKRIDAISTVPNMAAGFLLEEISFLTYSKEKKPKKTWGVLTRHSKKNSQIEIWRKSWTLINSSSKTDLAARPCWKVRMTVSTRSTKSMQAP